MVAMAGGSASTPPRPDGAAAGRRHLRLAIVLPNGVTLAPSVPNPELLIARFAKGFLSNVAVLVGIVIGGVVATLTGKMNFDKVAKAGWFDLVLPFEIATPTFDPILILTMTLVMIVVMIESTGMFLALGEMTGRKVDRPALTAGCVLMAWAP